MEDWNYASQEDDEDMSSENSTDLLPSIQKLAFQFKIDPNESKDRFEAAMTSQDENDDSNAKSDKWTPMKSETSLKCENVEKCTEKMLENEPKIDSNECELSQEEIIADDDTHQLSSLPEEEVESYQEKDKCDNQFSEKASLSSLDYENDEESSSSEDEKIEEEGRQATEDEEFSMEKLNEIAENNEMFEDAQNMMNEDRTVSFTTRLETIIKELGRVREELGKVRENCREESELLSKALEKALEYNKSIQESTVASLGWNDRYITPPSSPPTSNGDPALTNALLLENKLRIGRLNASAAYRAQLDQLEALVDKEMNALQDNMTRLEPLNRIAIDWENQVPPSEPKSLVYRHDYTVEVAVASSQVSVKPN